MDLITLVQTAVKELGITYGLLALDIKFRRYGDDDDGGMAGMRFADVGVRAVVVL